MDIQQLRTFILLAENENMSTTADIMKTSQPQVSRVLSSLEAELRVPLFDRKGRGIILNDFGRYYLPIAISTLNKLVEASHAFDDYRGKLYGTLKIACGAFAPILSSCFSRYIQDNPNVRIEQSNPSGVNQDSTEYDLVLSPMQNGHYFCESTHPVFQQLFSEEYHFVMSDKIDLDAGDRTSLSLTDCINFPFILMGGNNSFYHNSDYSFIRTMANAAGLPMPSYYAVGEFAFKLLLTKNGIGITLLPDSCLEIARSLIPNIRIYSIEGIPPQRSVILARKRDKDTTDIARAFWDIAIEEFRC